MRRSLSAALLLVALVACSRGDDSDIKVSFPKPAAAAAPVDPLDAEPLGPGDVRVTSTDGAIVLALIGDSVRFQLSDSLRNSVKEKIDSAADSSGGIGAMITRSVSGVVSSAMGFVVRIPVSDIQDIRYEDGRIEFETRGKNNSHFSMSGKGKGGEDHGRFSPADGQRFVDAVKRRQASL
jgi:hypothetical protein